MFGPHLPTRGDGLRLGTRGMGLLNSSRASEAAGRPATCLPTVWQSAALRRPPTQLGRLNRMFGPHLRVPTRGDGLGTRGMPVGAHHPDSNRNRPGMRPMAAACRRPGPTGRRRSAFTGSWIRSAALVLIIRGIRGYVRRGASRSRKCIVHMVFIWQILVFSQFQSRYTS